MGWPTSAGGASNDLRDRTVRFLTVDISFDAFELRGADFTVEADGSEMRFLNNLLDHTRLKVASNASAILVRTDDMMDPREDIGLFSTDEHGQPRFCREILGAPEWRSYVEGTEFVVVPDATYAMLLSRDVNAVEAVWANLKESAADLGIDQPDASDATVQEARTLFQTFVKAPPFVAFNAEPRSDSDWLQPDLNRLPLALRKLFDSPGRVDDAAAVLVELMLRQAGMRLPSTRGSDLSASVFSWTFLLPLLEVMPRTSERLRPHISPHLTPGSGWAGDLVLVARPAAGRLYLAELFIREMRRARRNCLWCDLGISYWRGAGAAVAYDLPNPSAEAAITAAVGAALPSLADPVVQMFAARDHCRWIRKLAFEHVTATGLAISDASLDATIASIRWRTLPGAWVGAEERYGHDEFGLSPLYSSLAAATGYDEAWEQGASSHDCPTEVSVRPMPRYTAAQEQLIKESESYLYYCLFGVDLYYRKLRGRTYENYLEQDDVDRAAATKDLAGLIGALLDGCHMSSLIGEGLLRGDHGSLQLRLLDARQNVGGDWSVAPAAGSDESQTSVLEALNEVLKPATTISEIFKSYYEGAVESEVWRLIRESGGPEQEPKKLKEKVEGFFERAKKLVGLFGEKPTTKTVTFSIGAQVVVDKVGAKVSATLLKEGGTQRAAAAVELYVLEKRGAVGAWPKLDQEELELRVNEIAGKAGAPSLVVPEAFEAFASVVGLTITLMNFDKELRACGTPLGQTVVVGKLAENVLSTTSSVMSATKTVLNALPEGFLLQVVENGSKGVRFTRLVEGLGGAAKWTSTAAEGVGAVLAVGELADTFLDPGSGLNVAVRAGDGELTAAQYNRTGFVAVSAAAGLAYMVGYAGIAVTGPIGLVCGFAIIVFDAYIAGLETEYHTLVARGVLQFEQCFDRAQANSATGAEQTVSRLTARLRDIARAMRSMAATAAYEEEGAE